MTNCWILECRARGVVTLQASRRTFEAEPEGFGPRLRELRDVLHDDLADAGLET
jgi:hypothetical protein